MKATIIVALLAALLSAPSASNGEGAKSSVDIQILVPRPNCAAKRKPTAMLACVVDVLGRVPPWPDRSPADRQWHVNDARLVLGRAARASQRSQMYFVAASSGLLGLRDAALDAVASEPLCNWAKEQISWGCIELACPEQEATTVPAGVLVHTEAESTARTRLREACNMELPACTTPPNCIGSFASLHRSYDALIVVQSDLDTTRTVGLDVIAQARVVDTWADRLDDAMVARFQELAAGTYEPKAGQLADLTFMLDVEKPGLEAAHELRLAFARSKLKLLSCDDPLMCEVTKKRIAIDRRDSANLLREYGALVELCAKPSHEVGCNAALKKLDVAVNRLQPMKDFF